jgi:hypothetical protein
MNAIGIALSKINNAGFGTAPQTTTVPNFAVIQYVSTVV